MSTENPTIELWAVHAQGPDDIYPAFDHADAEQLCALLNAIPTPVGISVAAVVIPSPMCELEHWRGVAELEHEHRLNLASQVAPTDANLSSMRREGLSIDGDNAYKRDLLDAVVGALAFGKQRSTPPAAGHWLERFYEIGKAEADERDAHAKQPSKSQCLWRREQDSGIYETGCGQTWAFTDGTTPEENSACFCHHCGGVLQVPQLIAYQVGDNDIVAAYDPEGAIEVLSTYCGYAKDEFTTDDVVLVNDETLDATEAFDQDEGKTIPLQKTLREELTELYEPAYLHGWE
ncbi:hypothetical protein [Pseudomonas sp. BLCC-B13]|uniref:hypothetical protein n=1 Tax=Pseudomonas sp. BLCC-B13 TaxID=3025314 RepID=UPI003FA68814